MLILLIAALALVQQPNCKNPQTQSDMNYCSGKKYEAADRVLNRQWQATATVIKANDKDLDRTYDKRPGYFAALLEGQRAWLKFRGAHCVSEGFMARGGSMEPLLVNACLEELTKARTKQLLDLMKMYQN